MGTWGVHSIILYTLVLKMSFKKLEKYKGIILCHYAPSLDPFEMNVFFCIVFFSDALFAWSPPLFGVS